MNSENGRPQSLVKLLEKIEGRNPGIRARQSRREVDLLIGRDPVPPKVPNPRMSQEPSHHKNSSRPTFDWYQSLVAAVPPLEIEGVAEAARAIEVGLFARERLSRLDSVRVPRQDLIDLHTLAERGESEYEKLLLSNVRLVFHWAKPMAKSVGADWVQDAFQVGFLGLMRGIQGWDYRKGFALSTYVSWHIRQTIQRWRANETDIIRLPVHVTDKLKSAPHDLSPEIRAAVTRSKQVGSVELLDLTEVGIQWDGGLEEVLDSVFRRRALDDLLGALSEQQRTVLRLRSGYRTGGESRTLEEIGQILGLTRERIRQIEKKALERARELH